MCYVTKIALAKASGIVKPSFTGVGKYVPPTEECGYFLNNLNYHRNYPLENSFPSGFL